MKKTVRLTESDLMRIVEEVINEQQTSGTTPSNKVPQACHSREIQDIKGALDSGYLEKIEFDYQKKAAFFSIKGRGVVCGITIQNFRGMF